MTTRIVLVTLLLAFCTIGSLSAQDEIIHSPAWQRSADQAAALAKERFQELRHTPLVVGQVATTADGLQITLNAVPDPSRTPGAPAVLCTLDSAQPGHPYVVSLLAPDRQDLPRAEPGTVNVHGILRNLPGYILNTPDFLGRFNIWAEAGGRVVATETELMGTTAYLLKRVPATVGTIIIKAKIRGYDLMTLHPGLAIPAQQPVGTIAGIDIDFHGLEPIRRPVRILVQSNSNSDQPSFPPGDRARVYVQETGQTGETVSQNGLGEVMIPDVITGWNIGILAVNLDKGYFTGKLGPLTIPEDGSTAYTSIIPLN